jgi:hypothetical protein
LALASVSAWSPAAVGGGNLEGEFDGPQPTNATESAIQVKIRERTFIEPSL